MVDEKSEEQTELLESWKKVAAGWETAATKWERAACEWEQVAHLRGCAVIVVTVVAFVCAIGWVVKG